MLHGIPLLLLILTYCAGPLLADVPYNVRDCVADSVSVRVRSEPKTSADKIDCLVAPTPVTVTDQVSFWRRIEVFTERITLKRYCTNTIHPIFYRMDSNEEGPSEDQAVSGDHVVFPNDGQVTEATEGHGAKWDTIPAQAAMPQC